MDKTLNIAICEDIETERDHLLSILKVSQFPMTIAVFERGEDFLAQYQLRKYDLIFMDIYMDGMTGIETATELRKIDELVDIAFTTSSLDYALESYRLGAIKYVEKPVSLKSILPILQQVHMQKEFVPKLVVKTKSGDVSIAMSDIIFLEQTGSRFLINTIGGEVITAMGKLATIIDQLDSACFYQCHKSYIVNFHFVQILNKELQVFEMLKGAHVHIRRDGFWKTKRAYEAFLFSTTPKGGA
ncbi:MAG: LytTR family DNA-binding domain-containing protein [Lachnospiraceae bacterium]